MRRTATVLAVIALCLLVAGGASAQVKVMSAETIGQYGGELRRGGASDPKTFNPYLAVEDSSTGQIFPFIFERLTQRNYITGEIEPELASGWEFGEDGRVWTFHLREGVLWHDGVEFTADDVVFTFDIVFDPEIPNNYRDSLIIDGQPLQYRKIDDHTVEFALPRPFPPMLESIGVPVIPKHVLEEPWKAGRFSEMWGIDMSVKDLIGTGPFKMVEYRPAERLTYERNPNYWRVDAEGNRLPYIERIVRHFLGGHDAQRLLFESGGSDALELNSAEVNEFEKKAREGNFTVHNAGPTFATLFTVFNQNERFVDEPKVNWFKNLNFRRAVAHATDKSSIIEIAYGGAAIDQYGPVSPSNKAFINEDVRRYEYDLDEAARLLAEAGFVKGRDGLLRDPEGNIVEFNLSTNTGNTGRETLAALLVEDLQELGMVVHYNPMAFNLLVKQLQTGEDWDAIIIGLPSVFDPHAEANVWKHDGNLHIWNVGHDEPRTEWEARVNELFDLAATELDPQKRYEYYAEWQEIIAEHVPLIYAVAPSLHAAVSNRVHNAAYTIGGGLMHNVHVLWLDPQ